MNAPLDYMTSSRELAKHARQARARGEVPMPQASRDLIEQVAAGDPVLFAAMWSFWNFAHAFDDLLDENVLGKGKQEELMTLLHDAVVGVLIEGESAAVLRLQRVWGRMLGLSGWEADQQQLAQQAWDNFWRSLRENPLLRRHAAEVRGLLVQCMTRCLDGDEMAHSPDARVACLAPAVRCGDVDVLMHLVYLARGWAALRTLSARRMYDLPDEPVIMKEGR